MKFHGVWDKIQDDENGKVAIADVFGDDTPELLYVYIPDVYNSYEFLKIVTYSKADGVETLFDTMMNDIGQVLFQSTSSIEYGLYMRDDLLKNITPFESESMTYDEAVAWLEEQKA